MLKQYCIPAFLLMFSGCSMNLQPLQQNLSAPAHSTLRNCAELYMETERTVVAAKVVDAQATRIAGYPYLRINRFLSGFRDELSDEAFEYWLDLLQQLALEGWQAELMNLPDKARNSLEVLSGKAQPASPTLLDALHTCGNIMRKHDLDEAAKQDRLRDKAAVPAEYQIWRRIAGLYPVTAIAFRLGIKHWHEQTMETFRLPLDKLPVTGRLMRYAPASPSFHVDVEEIADIINQSSDNPLAIPIPAPAQQQRLFDRFAPIFEIDVANRNDQIGAPAWSGEKTPAIETAKPTVYRLLSHTRVGDQILLQLNYQIWFPSRPKNSAFDLLGGELDGIIWRVTLLPDGKPWLFDSIHTCGCYHLFFPTRNTRILEQQAILDEPAFAPQPPLNVDLNAQPVIRIASGSHYIDRVYFSSDKSGHDIPYQWDDVGSLRSMPLPDGNRRSLFGQEGIIAGSERGERFLFWPMGIPNPGAMRQWGHHATAFVGHRHFDDPRLFEDLFAAYSPEETAIRE